jgi:outer membrane protein assembly factor BamB
MALLGLALWPGWAACAACDDGAVWTQFRGGLRTGIAHETGLLQSWPTNGPALRWAYTNCGSGYSGVTVSSGVILTAGTFSNGTSVIALSLEGRPLWTAPNGSGRWRVPADKKDWAVPFGGTRSTPTIADGRVFHLDVLGRLGAFDLETGREIWAMLLPDSFGGICNEWGYSESVLVDGDRLYCLPGGKKGFLVCLDAASGRTVWTCNDIPDTKASNGSCILVDIGGVRQIVVMTTVLVVGVRAEDGRLLWQFRHANRFRENCEIPQYANGILYVSSGYGHGSEGYAISPPAGTNDWTARQIWRQDQADNLHGGPIILDGCVYGAGYDRRGAFCLDLANGKFRWRNPGIGRSAYVFADGLLYRLGEDGEMALERPNSQRHEPVSSFRLPSARASACLTHPVVCGRRLYVRHQNVLYCYDVAADTQ